MERSKAGTKGKKSPEDPNYHNQNTIMYFDYDTLIYTL